MIDIDKPGVVTSGMSQARDEATAYRIREGHENDWYSGRLTPQCRNRQRCVCQDHVGMQFYYFFCRLLQPIRITCSPTIVYPNVSTLSPPEFLKAFLEGRDTSESFGITFGHPHQHANAPDLFKLLCTRRKWARECSAEKGD